MAYEDIRHILFVFTGLYLIVFQYERSDLLN